MEICPSQEEKRTLNQFVSSHKFPDTAKTKDIIGEIPSLMIKLSEPDSDARYRRTDKCI